jgi:hypothetical protein
MRGRVQAIVISSAHLFSVVPEKNVCCVCGSVLESTCVLASLAVGTGSSSDGTVVVVKQERRYLRLVLEAAAVSCEIPSAGSCPEKKREE